MTRKIITVEEDMSVRDLAAFLVEHEISGAPVLNAEGYLVGVVSMTDIAQSDADRTGTSRNDKSSRFFEEGTLKRLSREDYQGFHVEDEDLSVKDIMTPTLFTIPEQTPISQVAQTMYSGRIHRLLVTHEGRIAGIVTSLDLLRLLFE
jgi:CBS domain-containing protein